MAQVSIRCYAELNDFLPPDRRQRTFAHEFAGRVSVKDLVESLGIPHTEVDLIVVNGASVDVSYLVQDGDRISVYPVFESLDITSLVRVRPRPLREPRFVLDTHLGKLAGYLRLLGFDVLYQNDYDDDTLAGLSSRQQRILLTRDCGLLKRSAVTHGYYVRETNPERQVVEVLRRFDLFGVIEPFKRCLRCNGLLQPIPKAEIEHRLLPKTRRHYHKFNVCSECGHLYWKGSHYDRLRQFIERLLEQAPAE